MPAASSPATPPLRIGCAAGFSGDRTDAAGPVVEALIAGGGPAVLIFETPGRAHAGPGAAGAARRSGARLRAAARRRCCARCSGAASSTASASSATSAPPTRAARRGASLALAAELGLRAAADRRGARATTSARRRSGRCCDRRSAPAPTSNRRSRRWSAPTPTSAPSAIADALRAGARGRRHRPRRRSVARGRPGARPLRLGGATTGTGWRAPRWPATCSNAARR